MHLDKYTMVAGGAVVTLIGLLLGGGIVWYVESYSDIDVTGAALSAFGFTVAPLLVMAGVVMFVIGIAITEPSPDPTLVTRLTQPAHPVTPEGVSGIEGRTLDSDRK